MRLRRDLSTPSLWHWLFSSDLQGLHRKARWDLLRRGTIPDIPAWESLRGHWQVGQRQVCGDERVTKFRLQSLDSGDACETVVMRPRPVRGTVCISTQVGCGVGCIFCATGRMGRIRDLASTEILEQVLLAKMEVHAWSQRADRQIHLRNVVFMGMGEPLHNEQSVGEAIDFLIADRGFGFSPRHITLSTVGVPEKMVAMARRFPRLRIAVSLHAANRDLRRRLVPRATSDLDALRSSILEINALAPQEPVWLEYALLSGVNDQTEHAQELIAFCRELRVEVNLIPYNDTSHADPGLRGSESSMALSSPDRETARRFAQILRDAGLFTTLRNTLGDSIQAACGQLVTR
ncbi:MAG: radical SAM protein [Planctomycetota bacterium]|jgi:23S rRNA (adenine2503-C2)-methyltransferase